MTAQTELPHPGKRIPAGAVRGLCADISDMTLWRWLQDPDMDFPQPAYIGRRRYWREADVVTWLDARERDKPNRRVA